MYDFVKWTKALISVPMEIVKTVIHLKTKTGWEREICFYGEQPIKNDYFYREPPRIELEPKPDENPPKELRFQIVNSNREELTSRYGIMHYYYEEK